MGCLQSITCKARVRREGIAVYDVCATIDQAPTLIEETSPIVLRYKTPYFKASARVAMPPIPRRETWVVGWIQACNQMEFFNTYSDLGMRFTQNSSGGPFQPVIPNRKTDGGSERSRRIILPGIGCRFPSFPVINFPRRSGAGDFWYLAGS
uniref:Family with sequence similarity 78 member B n=1 Tax=Ornithorhynchus anatinus TaxID=9258 RepID=A0A6I8P7V4_ORNAN